MRELVEAMVEKCNLHYEAGEYEEAIKCLDRILEYHPNAPAVWHARGKCLYEMRKYREAIQNFERALKLQEDPNFHFSKGLAHFQLFEYSEAIKEFEKAAKEEKFNADVRFMLSLCKLFSGDEAGAREEFKRSFEIDGERTLELLERYTKAYLRDERAEKLVRAFKKLYQKLSRESTQSSP